jgi:uncharacterized protein YukE
VAIGEIKWGVALYAAGFERLKDHLSKLSDHFAGLSEKVHGAGEKLQQFGEKMSLISALASEGTAKLQEWSDSILEPAMSLQEHLSQVGAQTGLTADKLNELRERAVAFSNTHPGATAEQYVDAFGRMQQQVACAHEAVKTQKFTPVARPHLSKRS